VQERPVGVRKRGLLSAVLGRRGGENTAYLAHQSSFEPELAGLVKETVN
jgi:hypothetical protein